MKNKIDMRIMDKIRAADVKQTGDKIDLMGMAEERDHYKALMEYWKKRCEATDEESLLGLKYMAYHTEENKQAWKEALNKLDEIKSKEPMPQNVKP